MPRRTAVALRLYTTLALPLLTLALTAWPAAAQQAVTRADLEAFEARSIGPAVTGGRIHDIEADPDNPSTVYVASASGGIWRSWNRGHTWTPLTDGLSELVHRHGPPAILNVFVVFDRGWDRLSAVRSRNQVEDDC